MAQTTYRSPPITTQAARRQAYASLSALLDHLPAFGVDIVSLNTGGSPTVVTVVLTNPMPPDQEDHLNLTKV